MLDGHEYREIGYSVVTDRRPLTRRICDAVVPPVCRWIVGKMRLLEEAVPDAEARWEILRRALSGIANTTKGRPS